MIIYTDGACFGNPGPMGAGIVFVKSGKKVAEYAIPLGDGTNNRAEYLAVIRALEKAQEAGETEIVLRSDSSLLINQLRGSYRILDPKLRKLYREIVQLASGMSIQFEWVSRDDNVDADALSKKAAGMNE